MVTTNEKTTKKHNFNRGKNEDQQEIKSENTFCNARGDENMYEHTTQKSNTKQQTQSQQMRTNKTQSSLFQRVNKHVRRKLTQK